jgi:serine/threonine protein phosphatase 1
VSGRTLAIGDIHGCDRALEKLLRALSIAGDDTVVVLGDVIDRGPGSKQVVDRLLQLSRECRLVFILGNHEEMLLDALTEVSDDSVVTGWLQYGGAETLMSYGGNPEKIPVEHLEFFRSAINFLETDRDIFIHANLQPGVPLDRQQVEWLRWTHLTGHEVPQPSGKRIVCGHTPQRSGYPLAIPGWTCIDTFACGNGWLTCLDVGTNDYCQANQVGNLRFGSLKSGC